MLEKRHLMAAWGVMECMLFGGLIYGWASLVFVLKDEGIYADLCTYNTTSLEATAFPNASTIFNTPSLVFNISSPSSGPYKYAGTTQHNISVDVNGTVLVRSDSSDSEDEGHKCKLQDEKFSLVFTIASTLFCFSSAAAGQLHYMYGTRVTRCLSMFFFMFGSVTIGLTSIEHPWLIFLGLTCLGVGGLPVLMTNAQISYLFEKGGMYVSSLSGSYDSSVVVMLVIKVIYQNGMPRPYSFYFLAGLHLLVAVSTFCFLPKGHIQKETPVTEKEMANVKEELLDNDNSSSLKQNEIKSSKPRLRECMLSSKYILHVVWLSLLQLRFFYFMGTLNPWLSNIFDEDKEQVSKFTDACSYMMMCGFVFAFIVGALYDSQINYHSKNPVLAVRLLKPSIIPLLVTSTLAVLLSISVLITVEEVLYVSFLLLTMFRACMYGIYAAYTSILFPGEYFGILYGAGIIIGGVISALQYALFSWSAAYDNALQHVNIVLLCVSVASFVHPIYQFFSCRRIEKQADR